jgi:hypothetical protein
MKRILALIWIVMLMLAGCRRTPAETTLPLDTSGTIPVPQITLPEGTASDGPADWTVEGSAPEGDFQIPPQPTDQIITQ